MYITFYKPFLVLLIVAGVILTSNAHAETPDTSPPPSSPSKTKTSLSDVSNTLRDLGERLFFDANLSLHRNQSCATCHNPAQAFSDPRDNGVKGSASLGSDGKSLGDRNTPALGYAKFSPDFQQHKDGEFLGGQFWDGRANDLKAQAGGPIMNGIEMALPDTKALLARLNENTHYQLAFETLFDAATLTHEKDALYAVTTAIEHFEKSETFSPFDSKYDRYLKGEYELTKQEDLGMTLFFSEQFTNCNQCHQLKARPGVEQEIFTDYRYHNIGTPTNQRLRKANGLALDYQDKGLFHNPAVNDETQSGKFKTPTLRNVAVTGPYMHNGVFQDLRTVIGFYNKYNSKAAKRQINPETGLKWANPEVDVNLSLEELRSGPALDDRRIDALVAFLKTLTDKRYEHLLD